MPSLTDLATRVPGQLLFAYGLLWVACVVWLAWPAARRREGGWQMLGACALLAIGCYRLADPWWYQHDFNGALLSLSARNFVERGWAVTHGLELWNGGTGVPVVPRFYVNHPPLSSWMLAPGFALFGVHEWVARLSVLLPLVAALLFLFRVLAARGLALGPLGWTLAAALPGIAFYARSVGYEAVALALYATLAGLMLRPTPRRGDAVATVALGGLLVLSGWSGCLFSGTAGLLLLAQRRWRMLFPLAGGALAGGLIVLGLFGRHYQCDFTPLLDQFLRRSAGAESEGGRIASSLDWVARGIGLHLGALIGVVPLGLAAAGVRSATRLGLAPLVLWLFGAAVTLCLILRQWAFVHEFSACHIALPVLLLGLAALQAAIEARRPSPVLRFAVAAVLLAALLPGLWQTTVRYRKLIGFQHAQRVGLQVRAMTQPDEVILLAEKVPSPVFLFYAHRDFIVWPHPSLASAAKPTLYVRLRRGAAMDADMQLYLQAYEPVAGAPDLWRRRP